LAETLTILREAEQAARHRIERARHEAATLRSALPGEIDSLREEKNRRVAQEKRRLEAAARKEVEAAREALRTEIEGRLEALSATLPELEREALSILRSLLTEG